MRTARFALTPRIAVIGSTAPVRGNVTIGGLFGHHVTGTVRDATRSGFFKVLARAPASPLTDVATRHDFAAVFVFQLVVFVGTFFSPVLRSPRNGVSAFLLRLRAAFTHTFPPPVALAPRTSAIDRARRHGTRGPSRELLTFIRVDGTSLVLLNHALLSAFQFLMIRLRNDAPHVVVLPSEHRVRTFRG